MAAIAVSVLAAGCGTEGNRAGTVNGDRAAVVPDVTGEPLDRAADELEASGLVYESIGGGFPARGDERAWVVCDQRPRSGRPLDGARGRLVRLKVARRGGCASPTH